MGHPLPRNAEGKPVNASAHAIRVVLDALNDGVEQIARPSLLDRALDPARYPYVVGCPRNVIDGGFTHALGILRGKRKVVDVGRGRYAPGPGFRMGDRLSGDVTKRGAAETKIVNVPNGRPPAAPIAEPAPAPTLASFDAREAASPPARAPPAAPPKGFGGRVPQKAAPAIDEGAAIVLLEAVLGDDDATLDPRSRRRLEAARTLLGGGGA